ncbi:hypothetical protein MNV49_006487 [Pseudohyphozyma bogoriensis]|nr:hypothetical protein MNV49_006487 [Pseudohyphozyma bogoriensis]
MTDGGPVNVPGLLAPQAVATGIVAPLYVSWDLQILLSGICIALFGQYLRKGRFKRDSTAVKGLVVATFAMDMLAVVSNVATSVYWGVTQKRDIDSLWAQTWVDCVQPLLIGIVAVLVQSWFTARTARLFPTKVGKVVYSVVLASGIVLGFVGSILLVTVNFKYRDGISTSGLDALFSRAIEVWLWSSCFVDVVNSTAVVSLVGAITSASIDLGSYYVADINYLFWIFTGPTGQVSSCHPSAVAAPIASLSKRLGPVPPLPPSSIHSTAPDVHPITSFRSPTTTTLHYRDARPGTAGDNELTSFSLGSDAAAAPPTHHSTPAAPAADLSPYWSPEHETARRAAATFAPPRAQPAPAKPGLSPVRSPFATRTRPPRVTIASISSLSDDEAASISTCSSTGKEESTKGKAREEEGVDVMGGRGAHELTKMPATHSAWDFERLFDRRRKWFGVLDTSTKVPTGILSLPPELVLHILSLVGWENRTYNDRERQADLTQFALVHRWFVWPAQSLLFKSPSLKNAGRGGLFDRTLSGPSGTSLADLVVGIKYNCTTHQDTGHPDVLIRILEKTAKHLTGLSLAAVLFCHGEASERLLQAVMQAERVTTFTFGFGDFREGVRIAPLLQRWERLEDLTLNFIRLDAVVPKSLDSPSKPTYVLRSLSLSHVDIDSRVSVEWLLGSTKTALEELHLDRVVFTERDTSSGENQDHVTASTLIRSSAVLASLRRLTLKNVIFTLARQTAQTYPCFADSILPLCPLLEDFALGAAPDSELKFAALPLPKGIRRVEIVGKELFKQVGMLEILEGEGVPLLDTVLLVGAYRGAKEVQEVINHCTRRGVVFQNRLM